MKQRRFQAEAWQKLLDEASFASEYIYQGEVEVIEYSWLHQPLKQALKSLFILSSKKKAVQRIPIVGVAVAASANYQIPKKVGEFALRFYQKRGMAESQEQ
nr:EcsC family protein [Sediminibacillus albus]